MDNNKDAPSRRVWLHLASDSTGETLRMMTRAAAARFPDVAFEDVLHALARSPLQIDSVLRALERRPGVVVYTIIDAGLRSRLEEGCRRLGAPFLSALDALESLLGRYLGTAPEAGGAGAQHALDEAYFKRIAALDFALAHDDGLATETLSEADVVLVGVSRTSKTPTCIYLAGRGIKAANVALAPGAPLPESLTSTRALVVGLTASPERLVEVRRNRFPGLAGARGGSAYVRPDAVDDEAAAARALFARHGWPSLDVTGRSVEEIAAAVMTKLAARRSRAPGARAAQ